MILENLLQWPEDGLIPVVAQDATSNMVLMVAYMNRDALQLTLETGYVHYFSRSRGTLWRKGETSGNVQRLVATKVNCDRNSLLLEVEQEGAVCHDGYPSCYYRELIDDEWHITLERAFDPNVVYGKNSETLEELSMLQFGAYVWLREHPLESESETSRRLRSSDDEISPRVSDELSELAAAMEGVHLHGTIDQTIRLEAGQVLYWVMLWAVRSGWEWAELRPDLVFHEASAHSKSEADDILQVQMAWLDPTAQSPGLARATLEVVQRVISKHHISAEDLIADDIKALRSKPYLAPYFTRELGAAT
ncbi:MAG: phosphoribosyl-AMP cyclohydrolase [Chloroflexota bacterium]